MTEKKHYFVTVDTEEIRQFSIPGNGVEYEIVANHDEVKEVEMLLLEKEKNGKQATDYLNKPFDEWGVDDERKKYDQDLIKLYQKLYELGTKSTKEKITEIGLLK
ncbi:hypothetical protein [Virgibacillus sp. DJP39]|uniref:hypothetical protein n=1 Tax=Virgibacillus sp. DJP39 TaxID=3409790 RepID=UPI003BB71CDE